MYAELTNASYKLPFDELVAESLNLVSQMPNWIPAKNKGENVTSYYYLPIQFDIIKYNRLQRKKQKKSDK